MNWAAAALTATALALLAHAASCFTPALASQDRVDSLDAFVSRLNATLKLPLDDDLRPCHEFHAAYYNSLRPIATLRDAATGSVIDCVPYEHQPALMFADSLSVASAQERLREVQAEEATLPAHTKCPRGSIEVRRPRLVANGPGHAHLAVCRFESLHRAQHAGRQQRAQSLKEEKAAAMAAGGDYFHHVMPPYESVGGVMDAWLILGVGPAVGVPLPTCPADGAAHTLNQMWVLTGGFSHSLEAGWIVSNYWSSNLSLSLFAFSTNDNYAGSPGDQYNYLGGFIGYTSSIPQLGASVASVTMALRWRFVSGTGWELQAKEFAIAANGTAAFTTAAWTPLGYYPLSRQNATTGYDIMSVGAETVVQLGSPSTTSVAGNIYGWGTDATGAIPINAAAGCQCSSTTAFLCNLGSANPFRNSTLTSGTYYSFSGTEHL